MLKPLNTPLLSWVKVDFQLRDHQVSCVRLWCPKDLINIVIAHNLDTIKNADLILVLKEGAIVQSGRHDELSAIKGEFKQLIAGQN